MRFEEIYENETIATREKDNLIIARVSEVQRELFKVLCEHGERNAKFKGAFYKDKMDKEHPVVGDYVLLKYNEGGNSLIEKICERKSSFSRTDFSGHDAGHVKTVKKQVIAANMVKILNNHIL